ncbi:MAG: hypoxanthine phosphoribosyltransferase [Pseudomonadota bacterium]
MKIHDDVRKRLRVLYSENDIAKRIKEIAAKLAEKQLDDPLAITILKGSFIFAADLLRAMHYAGIETEVEFMMISSYRKGTQSGQIEIKKDIDSPVENRNVILIDDILETGRTLAHARDLLMARGAKRVLTCCLLEKPGKRAVAIEADCVGFTCPDQFVVGYGMDMGHSFRELPYIGYLPQEERGETR